MDVIRWTDFLWDVFAPRADCMVCDAPHDVRGGICTACREKLHPMPEETLVCTRCGYPLYGAVELCRRCCAQEPSYAQARQAYVYDETARALVHRMKFGGEYQLPVRFFAEAMAGIVHDHIWPVDGVISIPSAPKTLRTRGYNQAEVLARRVAHLLGKPFYPHVLEKANVPTQVGLDAKARRENLKDAFLLGKNCGSILHKNVLLVDDVMTTGTTVEMAARRLRTALPQEIYVVCAARALIEDKESAYAAMFDL